MNGHRASVVYVRASTEKQTLSPQAQWLAAEAYHKENGRLPPLYYKPYADPGKSGKTPLDSRPAGHQLLIDLQRGDHLIVAAFDRLGRDVVDLLTTIRLLHKRGIVVHLLDLLFISRLDPDDPQTEMYLTQFAAFAQHERTRISVRTKQGLRAKRAQGYSVGYGRPRGFRKIQNPEWTIDSPKGIGRFILVPDENDKRYFDAAYAAWMGGEKITRIQRQQKNWPGAGEWSYKRLYDCLHAELRRREAEEARVERQRVFG